MLTTYPWDEKYRVSDANDVLTPALIVYPDVIAANIARTLRVLDNKAERWRAHIKTSKLGFTLRMLLENGVRTFKCATTLELLTACSIGAEDVLVAYPVMAANARRVRAIAEQFLSVRISVLAETPEQVMQWRGSRVGIFLDINPGMNRTGIDQKNSSRVMQLIREIENCKLDFRGLHYYDGQYGSMEAAERTSAAHAGYDRLLQLIQEIQQNGFRVPEIVTAGTPTFPCSLTYKGFQSPGFAHRVSPGTLVYNDAVSLAQLPQEFGYEPAVLVLSRVVSHPASDIVTCDAGHKSVSADAGVPTCVVIGHPELRPLSPSEEHLPLQLKESRGPSIGDAVYLLPRHVCPTVNNFDLALAVRDGKIESIERVTARGREAPLAPLPDRISGLPTRYLVEASAGKS
jgi:D-serine deaminase-like pyridoxal phosphate-dependent protein